MLNRTAAPWALLFALCTAPLAHAAGDGQVVNHEAPGNLQKLQPLECVAVAQVSNTATPPDIYHGVAACAAQQRKEAMIALYLLGNMYARYDTLRVSDRTAHQAYSAMQMQLGQQMSDADREMFGEALNASLNDTAFIAQTCQNIRRVGPPNYHPTYMIQHGMGAFLGRQGDGLEQAFDGAASWQTLLTDYLKCPAS